jgi:hypothetical protein
MSATESLSNAALDSGVTLASQVVEGRRKEVPRWADTHHGQDSLP